MPVTGRRVRVTCDPRVRRICTCVAVSMDRPTGAEHMMTKRSLLRGGAAAFLAGLGLAARGAGARAAGSLR